MAERAPRDDERTRLRRAFARRTGTDERDWYLVFKARYGMREVFAALRGANGPGAVVTTLFTGCTAADSIVSAGLEPRYAAIDPATLTVDPEALELDGEVRAVIVQNSYGIIDDARSAVCAERAHEAGALLMEDSAHCVARMARRPDGRPIADVSVHSLGIEKQFSIGFGGAIWVNPEMVDAAARERIVGALETLPELPERLDRAARRYRTQNRVLAHLPHGLAHHARAALASAGLLELPVADAERRGRLPYPSYQMSERIAAQIAGAFEGIDEDEARRSIWVAGYADALEGESGLSIPAGALGVGRTQSLIRFPIILEDETRARELISDLRAHGLYCVDWYCVPFYPGATDLAAYAMSEDAEAYRAFRRTYGGIVGLPTDIDVSRQGEALDIVRRHLPRP